MLVCHPKCEGCLNERDNCISCANHFTRDI